MNVGNAVAVNSGATATGVNDMYQTGRVRADSGTRGFHIQSVN